jgi:Na+/H+ antiporter NhaD/arsenite permease-like protein
MFGIAGPRPQTGYQSPPALQQGYAINQWTVDLSRANAAPVRHGNKHAIVIGFISLGFLALSMYSLSHDYSVDMSAATSGLTYKSYLTCFLTFMALGAMIKGGPPEGVLLFNTTCLLLLGIITQEQAWRGFRDENVLAIAVLFAVAKGVDNTMIVKEALQYLMGGKQMTCFAIFRMCICVAGVSAILNNTPVVAMMIPFVVDWDRRTGEGTGLYASQLLIPLSFASMLGGMCTLIGTSTNLILNGLLSTCVGEDSAFYIFDTFLVGGPVCFAGICYMTIMAPLILPKTRLPPLKKEDSKEEEKEDTGEEEGGEAVEQLNSFQRWVMCKGTNRLAPEKKMIAGFMICVMLGLSASKATSLLEAALITVSVFVFTNVLTVEEAFNSVNWEVIVTIVGSYGLSNALQDTNVTSKISDMIRLVGTGCDLRLMVVLFVTTVFLSSIVSNQASGTHTHSHPLTHISLAPTHSHFTRTHSHPLTHIPLAPTHTHSLTFAPGDGYPTVPGREGAIQLLTNDARTANQDSHMRLLSRRSRQLL